MLMIVILLLFHELYNYLSFKNLRVKFDYYLYHWNTIDKNCSSKLLFNV